MCEDERIVQDWEFLVGKSLRLRESLIKGSLCG
jgi:hypothetical protein